MGRNGRLLAMSPLSIFLTTFNTNLQGSEALDQDLSSWLLPVLHDATIDSPSDQLPDIYAIAVQELLPLHLALAGLSRPVLVLLTSRIKSLLSAHAKALTGTNETFNLVSRVSHVGIALWVFARQNTLGGRIGRIQSTSLGVGFQPLGMGNKGAVATRIFVDRGEDEQQWESLTFISAHLEAHDHNLELRNANYQMLLKGLIFPATAVLDRPTQIHETSHLFVMGDLNYRLARLPKSGVYPTTKTDQDPSTLLSERTALVDLDTLRAEQKGGRVFGGLREGDLRNFAPTYKRINGAVEGYSHKRTPGYTDRILFASHNDPAYAHQSLTSQPNLGPDFTAVSLFNSTESITLSDHKPVHAIIRLPTCRLKSSSPHLAPTLPAPPQPHPQRPAPIDSTSLLLMRLLGSAADRLVGWPWCILHLMGGGDTKRGFVAAIMILSAWTLWRTGLISTLFM